LVFRQAYETLVRLDCDGHAVPGLAAEWEGSEAGRVWIFRLRPGASYWDGSPVSPADVRKCWEGTAALESSPDRVGPWRWASPESVRTLEDGRIVIGLTRSAGAEPILFAHPALAVGRRNGEGSWPLGTGAYRIADRSSAWDVSLSPNPRRSPETAGRNDLSFSVYLGSDPRDFLERTDLTLLRSRATIEFAEGVRSFTTIPLAWSRLTLVVLGEPEKAAAMVPDWSGFRRELAEQVVESDARPAGATDEDWMNAQACRLEAPGRPGTTGLAEWAGGTFRVAHRDEDADAGRVAARLVGLWPSGTPSPVAIGLGAPAFLGSLQSGNSWAYIVSLRRSFPEPCFDVAGLVDSIGWLRCRAGGCEGNGHALLDLERAGTPLLVSRDHLALRHGVTGIRQDWDGTVLLDRAGWKAESSP
jgi:hypothetical protein